MGIDINEMEQIYLKSAPAQEEMELDGWILRFTGGYNPGFNCVIPLSQNEGDLNEKVARCEKEYEKRGLKAIFKLLSNTPAKLSSVLEHRGYNYINKTLTMTLDLTNYYPFPVLTDRISSNEAITEEWIEALVMIRNLPERESEALREALHKITDPVISAYYISNEIIKGTTLGIIEGDYLGIYFIGVRNPWNRPEKLQDALLNRVLERGSEKGIKTAYARALSTGDKDIEFFTRFGFEEAYSFIYRQQP